MFEVTAATRKVLHYQTLANCTNIYNCPERFKFVLYDKDDYRIWKTTFQIISDFFCLNIIIIIENIKLNIISHVNIVMEFWKV